MARWQPRRPEAHGRRLKGGQAYPQGTYRRRDGAPRRLLLAASSVYMTSRSWPWSRWNHPRRSTTRLRAHLETMGHECASMHARCAYSHGAHRTYPSVAPAGPLRQRRASRAERAPMPPRQVVLRRLLRRRPQHQQQCRPPRAKPPSDHLTGKEHQWSRQCSKFLFLL